MNRRKNISLWILSDRGKKVTPLVQVIVSSIGHSYQDPSVGPTPIREADIAQVEPFTSMGPRVVLHQSDGQAIAEVASHKSSLEQSLSNQTSSRAYESSAACVKAGNIDEARAAIARMHEATCQLFGRHPSSHICSRCDLTSNDVNVAAQVIQLVCKS